MPITGTQAALAAKLRSAITAKLTKATKQPIKNPEFLQAICEGIAETIIPHLTTNVQVLPGQLIAGATSPVSLAAPAAIPNTAATSTPGKIA